MARDVVKIKEDMRAEIAKLKEDLKHEMKSYQECIERELRNQIRDLIVEQQNLSKSIEFAHADIKELREALKTEVAANKKFASDNAALEIKCQGLEKRNLELEVRLTRSEQYSRNMNLEIRGVLQQPDENVVDVIGKIGSAIQETISSADIESCHRVPTRDAQKSNIVIQFKSRAKRDATLKKGKRARLCNSDIGLGGPAPIYINEHLCPALKQLLGKAISRKRECHWKSVWSFNGKIFARRSDDEPSIVIEHDGDLAKIR